MPNKIAQVRKASPSPNPDVKRHMKQEHRLVAEIYRYLAPFIDADREIYLSLDGQAARMGVAAGRFVDPDVPDLWFTLVGTDAPFRLEAKVLGGNRALLMASQIRAWRSNGTSQYRPHGWVAANREFDRFFYWRHHEFVASLDKCTATQPTHELAAPKNKLSFSTVAELALHILRLVPDNSSEPTPLRAQLDLGVSHNNPIAAANERD